VWFGYWALVLFLTRRGGSVRAVTAQAAR
jgi:hypothetical protein